MRIVSLAVVVVALSTHNLSGQIPARLSLADLRYLPGVWVLDLESSGLLEADAEQRTMTPGGFTVNKQAVTLTERVPLVPGLNLPVDVMLRVEHGYEGVAPSGSRRSPNSSSARKIFQRQR